VGCDKEQLWYFVGFYSADGASSYVQDGVFRLYLKRTKENKLILNYIIEGVLPFVKSNSIKIIPKHRFDLRTNKTYKQYKVRFGSVFLRDYLHGVGWKKEVNMLKIGRFHCKQCAKSFAAGIIDGNGCVYKVKNRNYSRLVIASRNKHISETLIIFFKSFGVDFKLHLPAGTQIYLSSTRFKKMKSVLKRVLMKRKRGENHWS
jgi:hypothetical protein